MAATIVIAGGSFGGPTAASELRRRLSPEQAQIILISKASRFVFVLSLPWIAIGCRSVDDILFTLGPVLARKDVDFVHDSVQLIDSQKKTVSTGRADYHYDFLVVATGHRSANEAVPGLGPFDGPGQSMMSAPEAEELNQAINRLLHQPGPIVVAAAPGASMPSASQRLWHRSRRHRCPSISPRPQT